MGGDDEPSSREGEVSLAACLSAVAGVARGHDARARTLLAVAGGLAALMALELGAGAALGSIGLLADGLHLLFHALGVAVQLWGALNARRGPTAAFSYGFARYEVLTTFSNATLLIFMQLFLLSGIVHRAIEPATFASDSAAAAPRLKVLFGGAGIALNVWAVLSLGARSGGDALARFRGAGGVPAAGGAGAPRAAAAARGGGGGGAGDGGGAAASLYSDAVSSLFLVVSAFAAPHVGVVTADVVQALASAAVTLSVVVPLAAAAAECLLQAVPAAAAAALERARRDALAIDGVLEVTAAHYWLQAPGHAVATVALRVRHEASEGAVLAAARRAYARVAADLTVQVEKDARVETWAELAAGMGLVAPPGGAGGGGSGAPAPPAAPAFAVAVVGDEPAAAPASSGAVLRAHHGHSHAADGGGGCDGHAHAHR